MFWQGIQGTVAYAKQHEEIAKELGLTPSRVHGLLSWSVTSQRFCKLSNNCSPQFAHSSNVIYLAGVSLFGGMEPKALNN